MWIRTETWLQIRRQYRILKLVDRNRLSRKAMKRLGSLMEKAEYESSQLLKKGQ